MVGNVSEWTLDGDVPPIENPWPEVPTLGYVACEAGCVDPVATFNDVIAVRRGGGAGCLSDVSDQWKGRVTYRAWMLREDAMAGVRCVRPQGPAEE